VDREGERWRWIEKERGGEGERGTVVDREGKRRREKETEKQIL